MYKLLHFDVIVLIAYIYHNTKNVKEHNKALKSIYKRYCEDVIKRHKLPATLVEYVQENLNYL